MKKLTDGHFYVTDKISPRRSKTPEGFLLCEAVPISRIGEFEYSGAETGIPADNGKVMLTRTAEQLFDADTIASFEGKPVVIGHRQFADPTNWKQIAVGTVQNVRRGSGEDSDLLLADLLLTDAEGIRLVESGEMTEVSCGYDAELVQDARGRGHVEGIVGNHVALVSKARCGELCSIGDGSMSLSFKQLLRKAFRAGDEDAFNEALDKVDIEQKEEIEDEAAEEVDKFDILEKRLSEVERMLGDLIHKNDVEESEGKAADDVAEEIEDAEPEEEQPVPDPEAEIVPDDEAEKALADAKCVADGMKKPCGDSADGHFTRGMLERVCRKALTDGNVTMFGDPAELSGKALTVALTAAAEMARSSRNPKAVEIKDSKPSRLSASELINKYWETH